MFLYTNEFLNPLFQWSVTISKILNPCSCYLNIANYTNRPFQVLATGLSGLYSSLPRKITPENDSWYMLTDEDCSHIPDLHMFLNSLDFCNAVVQVRSG